MLEVKDLHVSYGAIKAVKGISFNVEEGEIVTLIGANGAGKSTTLRTISGLETAASGSISFMGTDITKMPPHNIVKQGIAHVPEGRRVFANLTVMGNLKLGANLRKDTEGIKKDIKRVFELFPRLEERQNQSAGTLSGGEQQMLAMGRGLMSNPELILLDEPSLGLAPILINTIFEIILEIKRMGKTILLVEQNAFKALSVADKAYVLNQGRISMSGDGAAIMANPSIREEYLGKAQ